jgi:predicted Zn-dependent peptidase
MAFTDPQSVTVDAVPYSMPRISSDGTGALYSTADEAFKMRISHQESKGRTRRMVRLDKRVVAADPLTAVNVYQSVGVYLVIDQPEYGFSIDNIDDIVQGFKTWLSTANVTKVCGSES